jgi:hypothetical protein
MTHDEVIAEVEATRKDLAAFKKAYDAIKGRILERRGENSIKAETFEGWAGTQGSISVLIMCVTRCEGLIEDMETWLTNNPQEEEPKPKLELVENKDG